MHRPLHSPHDIGRLPDDGYIVLPLSLSRLRNGQNPSVCYDIVRYFTCKEQSRSHDFILLYTDGLYYNNESPSFELRRKFNHEMLAHRNALTHLIEKDGHLVPTAFHFLPWDYILLSTPEFTRCYNMLVERLRCDAEFTRALHDNLGERPDTEVNRQFILEEVAANHVIRQRLVVFPKRLVNHDHFRLIVYPGAHGLADLYQWRHKLLPQADRSGNAENPYYASHYDWNQHLLFNFDQLPAP